MPPFCLAPNKQPEPCPTLTSETATAYSVTPAPASTTIQPKAVINSNKTTTLEAFPTLHIETHLDPTSTPIDVVHADSTPSVSTPTATTVSASRPTNIDVIHADSTPPVSTPIATTVSASRPTNLQSSTLWGIGLGLAGVFFFLWLFFFIRYCKQRKQKDSEKKQGPNVINHDTDDTGNIKSDTVGLESEQKLHELDGSRTQILEIDGNEKYEFEGDMRVEAAGPKTPLEALATSSVPVIGWSSLDRG